MADLRAGRLAIIRVALMVASLVESTVESTADMLVMLASTTAVLTAE